MSLHENEIFNEQRVENCDICNGAGVVLVDEVVDASDPHITAPLGEKKCICQLNLPEYEPDLV